MAAYYCFLFVNLIDICIQLHRRDISEENKEKKNIIEQVWVFIYKIYINIFWSDFINIQYINPIIDLKYHRYPLQSLSQNCEISFENYSKEFSKIKRMHK